MGWWKWQVSGGCSTPHTYPSPLPIGYSSRPMPWRGHERRIGFGGLLIPLALLISLALLLKITAVVLQEEVKAAVILVPIETELMGRGFPPPYFPLLPSASLKSTRCRESWEQNTSMILPAQAVLKKHWMTKRWGGNNT